MSNLNKSGLATMALLLLSACGQTEPLALVPVRTSALPDGKVTIDGEEYVLKRATALNGRRAGEEVWAIVVDGKTYSCRAPNDFSCGVALQRAKTGQRQEEDMGY